MRTLSLLLLLASGSTARAQAPAAASDERPVHPVEQVLNDQYDACRSRFAQADTSATVYCTDEAYRSWERELNRAAQELLARLAGPAKTNFREAQQRWLHLQNAEFLAIDGIYGLPGDEARVLAANQAQLAFIQERTRTLLRYLEALDAPLAQTP